MEYDLILVVVNMKQRDAELQAGISHPAGDILAELDEHE